MRLFNHQVPSELVLEILEWSDTHDQWSFAQTCGTAYALAKEHILFRSIAIGVEETGIYSYIWGVSPPNSHLIGSPYGWVPAYFLSNLLSFEDRELIIKRNLRKDIIALETTGIAHHIRYVMLFTS